MSGLGTIDLIDADSPVSDNDLRWLVDAIRKIEAADVPAAIRLAKQRTQARRAS